jgi:multimeric flavodoxin WrbA/putative sterol carrier protein
MEMGTKATWEQNPPHKKERLMKKRINAVLFVTSFIPVVVFKIVSRGGAGTVDQVKLAVLLGLILAAVQFGLSLRFLKHTTYLERAFLGFLGFGIAWAFLAPPDAARLFALYSTFLLYVTLFFVTLLPQLLEYEPFTYTIARQWYHETVWNTPQFLTINLHITYFWSAVFLACSVSSFLGHGRWIYTVALPLVCVLGVGLPFSRLYPAYYLKRRFSEPAVDPSFVPDSARQLVLDMPKGFDATAGVGIEGDIQFDLSGDGGGKLVLSIAEGKCTAREGESLSPVLAIKAPADVWLKMAKGEINRAQALIDGVYTVEGDVALLTRMGDLFTRRGKDAPVQETVGKETKEEMSMKIIAVQGSPRARAGNTETLLRQFLKGAESQGTKTETIYLRDKDIHWCTGCYTCWTKTPGVCVFKDDMPGLLEKVKECDVLVYATPLYNFNMTALTKAFEERLLPLYDPHFVKEAEVYRHPMRYPKERKIVLVSNCGFPEISHFDALRHVFRHIEKLGTRPLMAGEILMPAGELLRQPVFALKTGPVLEAAYRAGVELVRDGQVSKETEALIQTPCIAPDEMAAMTNLFWDDQIERKERIGARPGKVGDMRLLLAGMAATFNAQAAGDLKAVIQFNVTGLQPGQWFLSIAEGKCSVGEGMSNSPTVTIDTLSEVWLAIANKELDGQKAFLEGKYTVQGDMGFMMRMKSLFGN